MDHGLVAMKHLIEVGQVVVTVHVWDIRHKVEKGYTPLGMRTFAP